MEFSYCKLEIFVPESHLEQIRAALRSVDAGHIGHYDSCLSYHPVTGCWRPLEGTHPWLGQAGKAAHPYEEPVINAIPLWRTGL